jgi:hypothetical protein
MMTGKEVGVLAFNPVPLVALAAVALVVSGVVAEVGRKRGRPTVSSTAESRSFAHPSSGTRGALRYVAAALCGIVTGLYLVFAFVVRTAEEQAGVTVDNTWGAYVILAVTYLVGVALLIVADLRTLWLAGAVVQAVVIAAFATLGVGALDYDALAQVPVGAWAGAVTGLQVVLLVLLSYLAATPAAGVSPWARTGSP